MAPGAGGVAGTVPRRAPASAALPPCSKFRLSYYPHRLEAFTALLKGAFQGKCQHSVLGDFQPYTPGQAHVPCYFIHVVKKTG